MPIRSTTTDAVRLTRAEFTQLTEQAEQAGQAHWVPPRIRTEGDLLQAETAAEGTKLLDVLFGEQVHGDASAREAYERGEISLKEMLGMSREEIEQAIADKQAASTNPDRDES